MKGYAGKILRIGLSANKISTTPDTSYNEYYIGGRGVGASILFNHVSLEVSPLDSKNL